MKKPYEAPALRSLGDIRAVTNGSWSGDALEYFTLKKIFQSVFDGSGPLDGAS